MKIILASESQYRKHALDILGLKYETIPSHIDEKAIRDENPRELARKLSEAKALTIGKAHLGAVVIAADLFVVYNNKIYEKPRDETEAHQMLSSLSGNKFEIVTGLAVYRHETNKMLSTTQVCEVTFRALIPEEIKDYIARYPVLKCAAAHEADGLLRFAENISGNYNFKAALPVNDLVLFLRAQGIKV